MAKVEVEVDVDLLEFSTDELIEDLCHRIERPGGRRQNEFTEQHRDILLETLKSGKEKNPSVIDQMKIDFFMQNMDKIDLTQLENIVR